jgi:hypothetical protein
VVSGFPGVLLFWVAFPWNEFGERGKEQIMTWVMESREVNEFGTNDGDVKTLFFECIRRRENDF